MTHKYEAIKTHTQARQPKADSSVGPKTDSSGGTNATTSSEGRVRCAVVGARGYSGLQLVRGLLKHPYAVITEAYASKSFPLNLELEEPGIDSVHVAGEEEVLQSKAEVVFLATPAEVSLKLVPALINQGKKVIDLSGAFRLQKNDIQSWYGFDVAPELLAQAHYGLVPFAVPMNKSEKTFVSNPGCYATAVQMALVPLLKNGLVDSSMIVVDAKSGTSGAGRKAQENQLFCEVAEDLRPYRVGRHQHQPEILEGLEKFAGSAPELFFTTQLLPIKHGIQAAIFAKTKVTGLAEIEAAFAEAFQNYPLVKFGRLEDQPQLANLNKVVGQPQTRISYQLRGKKLFVFSCIDNRLKGAATQAIENLNLWLGQPVEAGLTALYKDGGYV